MSRRDTGHQGRGGGHIQQKNGRYIRPVVLSFSNDEMEEGDAGSDSDFEVDTKKEVVLFHISCALCLYTN